MYVFGTILKKEAAAVFCELYHHLLNCSRGPCSQRSPPESRRLLSAASGHDCRNDPITYFGKQNLWRHPRSFSKHFPSLTYFSWPLNPTIKYSFLSETPLSLGLEETWQCLWERNPFLMCCFVREELPDISEETSCLIDQNLSWPVSNPAFTKNVIILDSLGSTNELGMGVTPLSHVSRGKHHNMEVGKGEPKGRDPA